MPDWLS
ncbi:uncharacterized protein FFM5_15337 [Fusarium fujikuroi]|nr:uncharacterized protein FFM5_15337 [Fusarium fujikuroi]